MTAIKRVAICPGTFDPITLGHFDIIERGLNLFDHIIVGVSQTAQKNVLLTLDERITLIKQTFAQRPEVSVECFEGLLIDFARRKKVKSILRGLRTVSDFEYEIQMATANRFLSSEVETLFMMTDGRFSHLSSSLIREILHFGGNIKGMVPQCIEAFLDKKKGNKL